MTVFEYYEKAIFIDIYEVLFNDKDGCIFK